MPQLRFTPVTANFGDTTRSDLAASQAASNPYSTLGKLLSDYGQNRRADAVQSLKNEFNQAGTQAELAAAQEAYQAQNLGFLKPQDIASLDAAFKAKGVGINNKITQDFQLGQLRNQQQNTVAANALGNSLAGKTNEEILAIKKAAPTNDAFTDQNIYRGILDKAISSNREAATAQTDITYQNLLSAIEGTEVTNPKQSKQDFDSFIAKYGSGLKADQIRNIRELANRKLSGQTVDEYTIGKAVRKQTALEKFKVTADAVNTRLKNSFNFNLGFGDLNKARDTVQKYRKQGIPEHVLDTALLTATEENTLSGNEFTVSDFEKIIQNYKQKTGSVFNK